MTVIEGNPPDSRARRAAQTAAAIVGGASGVVGFALTRLEANLEISMGRLANPVWWVIGVLPAAAGIWGVARARRAGRRWQVACAVGGGWSFSAAIVVSVGVVIHGYTIPAWNQ